MPRGFEDLFGPSFIDDPFSPRRVPTSRREPRRPGRTWTPQEPRPSRPRRGVHALEDEHRDRAHTPGEANRHGRAEETAPDQRARSLARDAVARAEAKHALDALLRAGELVVEREAEREIARQRRETIVPFLEVVDDMDRALAANDDPDDDMRRGVAMIRDRFLAKLRDQGVVAMVVDGESFDPKRHEALGVVPVSDPSLDATVVGVVRAGYTLDGTVLRPAGVTVGRMS